MKRVYGVTRWPRMIRRASRAIKNPQCTRKGWKDHCQLIIDENNNDIASLFVRVPDVIQVSFFARKTTALVSVISTAYYAKYYTPRPYPRMLLYGADFYGGDFDGDDMSSLLYPSTKPMLFARILSPLHVNTRLLTHADLFGNTKVRKNRH